MTTLHETVAYNVRASLNAHFIEQLALFDRPAWLQPSHWPGSMVVLNWPEIAANIPCFSINHLPGFNTDTYQGRNAGIGEKAIPEVAICEINAWVSRDQRWNNQDVWQPRLGFMEGMVKQAHLAAPAVVIKDYLGVPNAPLPTNFRVMLEDLATPSVSPDINPAVERVRMLITYRWNMRVEV
jgi:hypothetical protein